jgi:hypothetical protein
MFAMLSTQATELGKIRGQEFVMFVYVNGKEIEIGRISGKSSGASLGTVWTKRRNNIDIYLEAFDAASRFVWGKLKDAHESHQDRMAGESFRYLDKRTLKDIGLTQTDAVCMTCSPKPASVHKAVSGLPRAKSRPSQAVFGNSLFDGASS